MKNIRIALIDGVTDNKQNGTQDSGSFQLTWPVRSDIKYQAVKVSRCSLSTDSARPLCPHHCWSEAIQGSQMWLEAMVQGHGLRLSKASSMALRTQRATCETFTILYHHLRPDLRALDSLRL